MPSPLAVIIRLVPLPFWCPSSAGSGRGLASGQGLASITAAEDPEAASDDGSVGDGLRTALG